jgi:hypothetical protein
MKFIEFKKDFDEVNYKLKMIQWVVVAPLFPSKFDKFNPKIQKTGLTDHFVKLSLKKKIDKNYAKRY